MITSSVVTSDDASKTREGDAKRATIKYEGIEYDCTEYLDLHPGGRKILEMQLGRDIDESFRIAGHSEHAIRIMKELP